jgi:hypothetical protein
MFHNAGPLEKYAYAQDSKVGVSSSSNYDWSGQDLAQKRGDQLSEAEAAKKTALFKGDLESLMGLGRRIADLQGYLNAYKHGGAYDGVYGEVMPAVRLDGQSNGVDVASGSEQAFAFHNPKHNIHKPKDWETPNYG